VTVQRDIKSGVNPPTGSLAERIRSHAGLLATIGLGVLVVLGFGLETVLSKNGLSKYPDVYGAYEVLPLVAGVLAIALARLLAGLLHRPADFYERAAGDLEEGEDA